LGWVCCVTTIAKKENKTNPPLPLWLCAIPIALALPLAESIYGCSVFRVQSLFELYNSK